MTDTRRVGEDEDLVPTSQAPVPPVATEPPPVTPGAGAPRHSRLGDRIFSSLSLGSGLLILATLAGITIFLVARSLPALTADPADIPGGKGFWSYVWPLAAGTVMAAIGALVLATPVAVGIALFISHYAPRRVALMVGFVIDLLAALPSVIFGMWGASVLAPEVVPAYEWLHRSLGFIPLFGEPSATGRTLLTVSIVLAVMILPIITAVSREVFLQTPRLHEEAALALGATKWEMIRMTVLPFGRPGVIGGVMLGLGRALGETMAVAILLSAGGFRWNLLGVGNQTIPGQIAAKFPESAGLELNTLIAAGLVLFLVTLVVNLIARWIVERRSEFSGAN